MPIDMGDQFRGLPMYDLIGGPLSAACDAQIRLANATAEFIQRIGFVTPMPTVADDTAVAQVSVADDRRFDGRTTFDVRFKPDMLAAVGPVHVTRHPIPWERGATTNVLPVSIGSGGLAITIKSGGLAGEQDVCHGTG